MEQRSAGEVDDVGDGADGTHRTVIDAPRIPHFAIARPRLIASLDGRSPVLVVRAPAGTGKSVLLAQWAHSAPGAEPRIWLTHDSGARDRVAFWRGVAAQLRATGLVGDIEFPDAADADPAALRRAVRRTFAAFTAGVTLIVDDVDDTSPDVAADLAWLARHVTALRVVVASRAITALESARNVVELDPIVVAGDELLFTPAEIAELIDAVGLDVALAEPLASATGAIPLLVRAVVVALSREPFDAGSAGLAERLARLANGPIHELLAGTRDERVRDFAMRVSPAEELTAELAHRMTGAHDSADLLDRAAAAGLGTWTDAASGRVFRIAPIVRESLHREFRRRHLSDAITAERILAQWLFDAGSELAAFSHAIGIADYSLASRFAYRDLFPLVRDHGPAVLALLRPISRLTLRRYPLLSLMIALMYNARRTHRLQALEYLALTAVASRTRRSRAAPQERAILHATEAAVQRVAGNIGAAMKSARAFDATVDELTVAQHEELDSSLPIMFAQTGMTQLYGGNSGLAIDAFARAHSLAPSGDPVGFHPLALLAGTLALDGEIVDARRHVEKLRTLDWAPQLRDGYQGAFMHLAEAILALEEFDFPAARAHADVMNPHLETLEHWPLFAHVLALADLGMGDPNRSDVTLRRELRARGRASITTLTGPPLIATRSVLLLATGRATEAAALLASAPRVPATALARARVALVTGRPSDTLSIIATIDTESLSPRLATDAHLLHAVATAELGETAAARAAVDLAGATMAEFGLRHPLSLLPLRHRETLAAIASAATRELLLDPRVPDIFPQALALITLTERERVVLERVARGGSLTEIAGDLHVSVNTLKSQLRAVYRKLEVGTREQALAAAARHGLLQR